MAMRQEPTERSFITQYSQDTTAYDENAHSSAPETEPLTSQDISGLKQSHADSPSVLRAGRKPTHNARQSELLEFAMNQGRKRRLGANDRNAVKKQKIHDGQHSTRPPLGPRSSPDAETHVYDNQTRTSSQVLPAKSSSSRKTATGAAKVAALHEFAGSSQNSNSAADLLTNAVSRTMVKPARKKLKSLLESKTDKLASQAKSTSGSSRQMPPLPLESTSNRHGAKKTAASESEDPMSPQTNAHALNKTDLPPTTDIDMIDRGQAGHVRSSQEDVAEPEVFDTHAEKSNGDTDVDEVIAVNPNSVDAAVKAASRAESTTSDSPTHDNDTPDSPTHNDTTSTTSKRKAVQEDVQAQPMFDSIPMPSSKSAKKTYKATTSKRARPSLDLDDVGSELVTDQALPQQQQQIEQMPSSNAETTARLSRSRKAKAVSNVFDLPSDDSDDTAQTSAQATTRSLPGRKSKPSATATEIASPAARKRPGPKVNSSNKKRDEHSDDTNSRTGPFSKDERDVVESAFQRVLRDLAVSREKLVQDLQDWRSASAARLKQELKYAFNGRSVTSLRKFCQRTYNSLEKGPWSTEDDDTLLRAYARNKDKWATIAQHVGRSAQSCRDHYRDVLSRQDNSLGPWPETEEQKLADIVEAQFTKIRKTLSDPDREELIKNVNWNLVCQHMDMTRNAKQCREKFQQLEKRKTNDHGQQRPEPSRESKSWIEARRQLKFFGKGDHYDIMHEIASSFEDQTQKFSDPMTFWVAVAMKNPGSKFSTPLRRAAFDNIFYGGKNQQLRDLPFAEVAAKMLDEFKKPSQLVRSWQPDDTTRSSGKTVSQMKATPSQKSKDASRKNSIGQKRNKIVTKAARSVDTVIESDDEIEALRPVNRFHAVNDPDMSKESRPKVTNGYVEDENQENEDEDNTLTMDSNGANAQLLSEANEAEEKETASAATASELSSSEEDDNA